MKLADFTKSWSSASVARLADELDRRGFEKTAFYVIEPKFWMMDPQWYPELDERKAVGMFLQDLVTKEVEALWRGANDYERCLIDRELRNIDLLEIAYAYVDMYEHQIRNNVFDNAPIAADIFAELERSYS